MEFRKIIMITLYAKQKKRHRCTIRKAFLSLLAIIWNCAFRCEYLSFTPLPFMSLFSVIHKAS